MANCRSVEPQVWAEVFQALVFYFSRRGLRQDAEDLAQKTLMTVLSREDFEFSSPGDFQKVCYGFASRILLAHRRGVRKHAAAELNPETPGPQQTLSGMKRTELEIFVKEVLELGEEALAKEHWKLVKTAAEQNLAGETSQFPEADANRMRVALHRARKKLANLTGWKSTKA